MADIRNYTIQFRKDTGQQWSTWNPTLGNGEPGYDTTTNRFKVGDGKTAWNDLSFHAGDAYQVAVDAGYSGTRTQWLASLIGPRGERGLQGPEGPQGRQGDKGDDGTGLSVEGVKESIEELPASGEAGEAYIIDGDFWTWDVLATEWRNAGPLSGAKGDKGDKGSPPTLETGRVINGPAPYATIYPDGPEGNYKIDFVLQQGLRGLQGTQGPKGDDGVGIKGDKGDDGRPGQDYNKEQLVEDLTVKEIARNRVPNPLMPDANTVETWGRGSAAQPYPEWIDGKLQWNPTGAGTNLITPLLVAEPGEEVSVTATVKTGRTDSRARISLYKGVTATAADRFTYIDGEYDGKEQVLTATGVVPEGETRFRIGISMLGAGAGNSTLEISHVTTSDTAFDGSTVSDNPLERYVWQGDPYNSDSILYYGALQETVLSDKVVRIEIAEETPAHNPEKEGTLYISPAPRTPIFTSLNEGLAEVTPRWHTSNPWTAGTSSVIKPSIPGFIDRGGLSLNTATRAENAEILVLGSLVTSWVSGQYLWGPVLRGEGPDGTPASATGIWLSLSYASSSLSLALGEYRPTVAQIASVAMPDTSVPAVDQKFWQRMRVEGTTILGKAWKQGEVEPENWMVSAQATVKGMGWIGIKSSTSASVSIDAMGVSFDSGKAPGAY